MKIYIIKGNNGEMYEDYYEWIKSVYIDKEKAHKERDRLNRKAKRDYEKEKGFYELCSYKIEEYEVVE